MPNATGVADGPLRVWAPSQMLVAARETIPRRVKGGGIAIMWERLEHYGLKRRERGTGREPTPLGPGYSASLGGEQGQVCRRCARAVPARACADRYLAM